MQTRHYTGVCLSGEDSIPTGRTFLAQVDGLNRKDDDFGSTIKFNGTDCNIVAHDPETGITVLRAMFDMPDAWKWRTAITFQNPLDKPFINLDGLV